MTSTLLVSELSNLISGAKRSSELKSTADKSLQELKSISVTSEQQLAGDLRSRPAFIEPFLIACGTHSSKYAGSGIVCLQRLVVLGGLPKSRLQDALEAFNSCADLGFDIQLKILQALPSLLQNYAAELEGDLLGGALQLCASLAAVKASTVSGVAAATLQQLVTTVFEKVWTEDKRNGCSAEMNEVPGDNGPIRLKPAAFDAYRVFRDLALAADERQTKFVQFSALPPDSSMELIWSSIDSNPELFQAHEELLSIIGANVFPLIVRALSERQPFSTTVRAIRILDLIMDRYMLRFQGDCEIALNLCTQSLEPDFAPLWKRALVLEVLRDFLSDSGHVVDAFTAFDSRDGGKPIIQDILSAFVRLSTEKPASIGLGQQSTVPTGPTSPGQNATDQATLDAAGGMAGVISSALGVAETSVAGISSQWSLPRSACMEQLDKSDPPSLPETYPYALVLECLNSLSDSLARIVLPLTVQHERSRAKSTNGTGGSNEHTGGRARSTSFRTRAVPLNPLDAKDAPYAKRVQAVAGIVDRCWPAVLATSSTFLNAALDDQYFRNLIKAYQRFAQVAGLLRLSTPRDALMTTLAKASVPPHVLNAAISEPVRSPTAESPRVFSNPRSLLSVDSLVSQASSLSLDANRRGSLEYFRPMLTVRNLLCLRALLNLAIALGPTLGSAFTVVVSALKQADMVLSTTTPQQLTRQSSFTAKQTDHPSVVQAFSSEVAAVEAAASRLLESTADYPNDAFVNVLQIFCKLLHGKGEELASPASPKPDQRPTTPRTPQTPLPQRRTFSGLPGISAVMEVQARDYHFVIPKLGNLAELNVPRFVNDESAESGWICLVDELMAIARTNDTPRDARRGATNVLVKLAEATIADVNKKELADRAAVQRRALGILLRLIDDIYFEDSELSSVDLEVQGHVLESLRAILERCGDTLVSGWNRIIAVISSAFEHDGATSRGAEDDEAQIDWSQVSFQLVSSQMGRTAFAATQLVCSDFMESLPANVIASLIELLHRFMCQTDDLNAALTTATMAWNLSDYLFTRVSDNDLAAFIEEAKEFDDLEDDMQPLVRDSRPAQWLLLLIRLREVASRPTKEIRNAAFQTLCNVFKSHGDDLAPPTWDLLLRNTVLHVARLDSYLYLQDDPDTSSKSDPSPDVDMSQTLIAGNAAIILQHQRLIEQVAKLPSLWEVFLSMLERYLDAEDYTLNTAVYSSLARVLSGIEPSSTVWKGPIYRTVALWLKRVPHFAPEVAANKRKHSNQDSFTAYAEAGEEIYRLTRDAISISQTRTMIDNLYHCIRNSDGPLYGADSNTLSPLQAKVLAIYKNMRLDQPNIPSCMVTVAAKLATLHHDATDGTVSTNKQSPTFVAIASESIAWLQELLSTKVADEDAIEADAVSTCVQGLQGVIESKYAYRIEHKGVPLWRKATTTSLQLARSALEKAEHSDEHTRVALWASFVSIACGIVKANDLHLIDDKQKIYDDQIFDTESFKFLRDVLTPGLNNLPDEICASYARSLFDASIIHPLEPAEVLSKDQSPLENLTKIRRGRVKKTPYSQREDMAYLCWKELVSLAIVNDSKLSKAAAPLLILRLAIPIRAYIADQPLRGRRPQPLSELEELLFAFEVVKGLEVEENEGVLDGEVKKLLYPLLVQAVGTAGDAWSGSLEVLRPLQAVLAALGNRR